MICDSRVEPTLTLLCLPGVAEQTVCLLSAEAKCLKDINFINLERSSEEEAKNKKNPESGFNNYFPGLEN
jgi:hypothetical protein